MKAGAERVLAQLRAAGGAACSGAELSARHGITRSQVWKDVQNLRALGYSIEAMPGDGYRLQSVPDRLYPQEIQHGLTTCWLGRRLEFHETIDSTNRRAQDWARAGAEHGSAVIAEAQSAGRGRLGRSFHSPAGLNLYTSIVLRPRLCTSEAPSWILAAAVAVAETVEASLPAGIVVEVKWPNDVMIRGRKTSGILVELSAEAGRVSHLVLGIGVNLNIDPSRFPQEFRQRATSLAAEAGRPIDRIDFTRRLFARLETTLDRCQSQGFDALRPDYEARLAAKSREVRVLDIDGSSSEGVVLGIGAQGALRLRDRAGSEFEVFAGDVSIAKESL